MNLEIKKIASYLALTIVVVGALLFGRHAYLVHKNKPDISNLMAIAGLSGAKIFTLDQSPELMAEIKRAETNPKEAVGALESALTKRIAEQVKVTRSFSHPDLPDARASLETSVAYSFRLIMLKQWKPGMSRQEIVKIYLGMTTGLQSRYNLKDRSEEFFGFK